MDMKSKFSMIALVLMLVGILFPLSTSAYAQDPEPPLDIRPMIFVHGGAGSGAQFESQAMRFTSNGYPANYIAVHEYDSTFTINTMADVWAGLDQLIVTLLEETDADQVDVIGHSLGTTVMHGYLAFPWRAANVSHYVNIDGRTADALPGGVPTLALWAGMGWSAVPGREIVGATNVLMPNQTHVEIATSVESFVEMYKFFTGKEPVTENILPEPPCEVELAGRAVIFPLNIGAESTTLEIWEVNGDTGTRSHTTPEAIYSLGGDGAWGPFDAKGGVNYEFALLREGAATHHLYYEPFLRSDYLIRLLTSIPGEGIAAYMNTSDHHSNLVITRYKEFWGDQGVNNDILEINGDNIVNDATCPVIKSTLMPTGVIGIFAYDKDADGVSDLTAPIPFYYMTGFMSGVDIYIPAATPPNGTISLVLTPRGGGGEVQVINVPNWASSNDRISIQFNDYLQDVRMLIGFGGLSIDSKWYCGETTIYIINAAVIDFRVDGKRVAWNIFDHCTYKKLEVYKGESELGLITILITKRFSAAYGPNVFFLGQLV